MENRGVALVASALLVSLGITGAGYFIGNALYKAKVSTNIATVKGLAERDVSADVGTWDVSFEASESTLPRAYESANLAKDKIVAFLKTASIADSEMKPQAFSVNKQEVRDNNNKLVDTSYHIYGSVQVRSEDVNKIEATAQQVGELAGQGVLLVSSTPQYQFTKLNEIKPQMLGEATRNARVAAEQFAKDANANVGSINSAEQGAFNFSARDGGENADESTSIHKKVRVVTTISFYLKD